MLPGGALKWKDLEKEAGPEGLPTDRGSTRLPSQRQLGHSLGASRECLAVGCFYWEINPIPGMFGERRGSPLFLLQQNVREQSRKIV